MNFYMMNYMISKFTMLSYRGWNKHTFTGMSQINYIFNEKFQNDTFNGPVSLTIYSYLFY
jgi:hypothetical protein